MGSKPLADADLRNVMLDLARLYRRTPDTFEGGQQVAAEAVKRISPLMRRVAGTSSLHYWLKQAVGAADRFEANPIRPPKSDLSIAFNALAQARLALKTAQAQEQRWRAEARQREPVVFCGTVYDYNRAGIVAFMAEQVDVTRWRELAEKRQRVRVTVELVE